MKVLFMPNWNGIDRGMANHESSYNESQICNLIGQIGNLEGIAKQDYTGVPGPIKTFAQKCIWGEKEIYVVKGIHQRWNAKNVQNAKPHIRIRWKFTVGANLTLNEQDLHVMLTQEFTNQTSTHRNAQPGYVACCWKTVGVTVVQYPVNERGQYVSGGHMYNTLQMWPAQIEQSVDWIQEDGPPHRRRTLSVGVNNCPLAWEWRSLQG